MSMPRSSLRSVRFSSAPLPTTGRTRRVAPSSMTLARSSAICTEMPALRVVSSSTTPRLIPASGPADGVFAWIEREIGQERMATIAAVMILYFIVRYHPRLIERLSSRRLASAIPRSTAWLYHPRFSKPEYTGRRPDTVIIFDIPAFGYAISRQPCCRWTRYHAGASSLTKVTGDHVAGADLPQCRDLTFASRFSIGAAGMKAAARWRIDRARDIAFQKAPLALDPRVGDWHRRQQGLGIRMQRVGEEGRFVGVLDDLTKVHHRDAVADMLDDREIVRDEQIGQVLFALQIHHQVDDLRLDRDVEGRNRLVADDQLGVQGQRSGDADALALSARKLVRVAAHLHAAQTDLIEKLSDTFFLLFAAGDAVHL